MRVAAIRLAVAEGALLIHGSGRESCVRKGRHPELEFGGTEVRLSGQKESERQERALGDRPLDAQSVDRSLLPGCPGWWGWLGRPKTTLLLSNKATAAFLRDLTIGPHYGSVDEFRLSEEFVCEFGSLGLVRARCHRAGLARMSPL